MTLDNRTFEKIRDTVYRHSGISLADSKKTLVSSRLGKRIRTLGLEGFKDYCEYLRADESGQELILLIDAISTNVTHFFREAKHFEVLAAALRERYAKGQRRFRIWCAASSTGEEPYSLAITVRENLGEDVDVRILATDISTSVLATAQQGVYEQKHVEKMDGEMLRRWFMRGSGKADGTFRVRPELSEMVRFGRLNLAEQVWPIKGPLDMIFCRNVMIYFENDLRARLVNKFYLLLAKDGLLFTGLSESLAKMAGDFTKIQPSVYQK
jgi:chemotaxis protein methyltransferase CheR